VKRSMQGRFNFNGWILPAVRYREWRINRSWYILAAAMLVAPWFVQLYNDFKVGPAHILIIQLIGGYGNTTIAASTVIAGGLGLVVFWYDFSQGRLAYVLEGAVERRHVWWTKAVYVSATIIGAYLLTGMAMEGAWLAVGQSGVSVTIVDAMAYMILVHLVIAATAMMVGSAIGNVIYAAIGVVVMVAWPTWLQSVIEMVIGGSAYRLEVGVQNLMAALSPASVIGNHLDLYVQSTPKVVAFSRFDQWLIVLWFGVWLGAMGWLGQRLFQKILWERFFDAFYFPVLWNGVYAGLALVTAWVYEAVNGSNLVGVNRLLLLLGIAAPMFFVWRWIVRQIGRRALWKIRSGVRP